MTEVIYDKEEYSEENEIEGEEIEQNSLQEQVVLGTTPTLKEKEIETPSLQEETELDVTIGELINSKLDTSAKKILGDFTFGEHGAIKMITDSDNGLWLSPTGILGKKSGDTTFSITSSGDATFAGSLSAPTGTLGTLEITSDGHIRGGQTAYRTGTGFWQGYDADTYKYSIKGSSGDEFYFDGQYIYYNGTRLTGELTFGNGSDGAATISSNTSLTRDMYYSSLTVNSGVTLTTNGYHIFCSGTVTNNGTIKWSGGKGSDGEETSGGAGFVSGASGLPSRYLGGSGDGGNGYSGATPGTEDGESTTSSLGSNGGDGADGYNGTNTYPGGSGGTASSPPNTSGSFNAYPKVVDLYDAIVGSRIYGGAGGGGGGGCRARETGIYYASGGAGGSGGGVVPIIAKSIVNEGTISADGGDGGDAYDDIRSGEYAGGGGGGGGGRIILIYQTLTNNGTLSVNGGTGGQGYDSNGANNSYNGSDGSNGIVYELQV